MKKILVTGGSGMVGKSLYKYLPNADYISSKDCNLRNEDAVISLMTNNKYDVVVHLAARVGGIIDNIKRPAEYFEDNIQMNTNILKWSRLTGVKQFIGILSTCIFPDIAESYPMTEEMLHQGPPTPTNFSYGYAKRCLAVQIDAYNAQYGTNYQYLIPCNLYGVYDKYGENSHFVAALLKKIYQMELRGDKKLELFGTGKPLRQFMDSDDLAIVITNCIEKEVYESFNIATDENISIRDIATIALEACGFNPEEIELSFDSTKPDGQYRKDVDTTKFKKILGEYKFIDLKTGIRRIYENRQNLFSK